MYINAAERKAKIPPINGGKSLRKILTLLGIILFAISTLIIYVSLENFKLAVETPNENLLPEITNCTIQRDVPYAQDANSYHLMNVYMPEGEGPFPAIVYIHGGGWVGGHRDGYDTKGVFYARRGIAGFSIDYSLATQNKSSWPQAIQDVILAIRHIKENSMQYRIDPQKIAVMGESAGGHLASLVGTLSGNESFLGGKAGNSAISSRVCLVMDYYGPTDFEFIGEHGSKFSLYGLIEKFLGGVTYEANRSRWIEASPATYVTADDPIFVIAHGTNDATVPIAISESFKSKLDLAGVSAYFVRIEGGSHEFSDEENMAVRYVLEQLLKQVFSLPGQLNYTMSSGSTFPASAPILKSDKIAYTLTADITGSALAVERNSITIDEKDYGSFLFASAWDTKQKILIQKSLTKPLQYKIRETGETCSPIQNCAMELGNQRAFAL